MLEFLKKLWKDYNIKFIYIFLLSISLPIINNIIPKFTQRLLENGILVYDKEAIMIITIIIIGLYGLKYLFNNIMQYQIIKINFNTISNLKKELINSIVNLPMTFHDKNSSEYLLTRINEVDNLSGLFSAGILTFIINTFTAIIAFFLIFKKNNILAILTISLIPLFIFICKRVFKKISEQLNKTLEYSAKTDEQMYAILKGTATLKQFNDEESILEGLNESIDNVTNTMLTQSFTVNNNTNLISFCSIAIQTFIIGIVALYITDGKLSIGDYLSISQYVALIYVPVLSYQSMGITLKPAIISFKRLKSLYSSSTSIISGKRFQMKSIDTLQVNNLCFSYDENTQIIKNINFKLKKGDKLLISGSNGCGKTTLAKLILGSYSGNIFFNSLELKNIDEKCIREKIAIVPQKPYLFNSSLLENIKIANNKLSDEEFYKKIENLKQLNLFRGIDLNIKSIENGKNLSGGQIQRISLARVLIRDYDVCIFDELTNSLDIDSKEILKEILKTEFNDKICIFITHDNYLDDLINYRINLYKNY